MVCHLLLYIVCILCWLLALYFSFVVLFGVLVGVASVAFRLVVYVFVLGFTCFTADRLMVMLIACYLIISCSICVCS